MASIHLTRDEAQNGCLPMVCATCGDDAVEWADRKLSTVRLWLLVIIRSRVTVRLPCCRRHRVESWNGWVRIRATRINSDGVSLTQVSPDFVDAVLEYREHPERFRRRRRAEEPMVVEAVGADEEEAPRSRRRRRDPGDEARSRLGCLMIALVAVGVTCCGGGLFLFNFVIHPASPGRNPPSSVQPKGPFSPAKPGPFGR